MRKSKINIIFEPEIKTTAIMKKSTQEINGVTIYNNFFIVLDNEAAKNFYEENEFIYQRTEVYVLSEEEEEEYGDEEPDFFHPISEKIFGDDKPTFDDEYTIYAVPYDMYSDFQKLIDLGAVLEGEFQGF